MIRQHGGSRKRSNGDAGARRYGQLPKISGHVGNNTRWRVRNCRRRILTTTGTAYR